MQNIFNEEMNTEFFNKKSNELLKHIQDELDVLSPSSLDEIVKKIIEYGIIQYRWAQYEGEKK